MATSSTDLWEECFVSGCGKDATWSFSCTCAHRSGRYFVCDECARARQCPNCMREVSENNIAPASDAPSALQEAVTDGDSAAGSSSESLNVSDICVVRPSAPPFACGQDFGYLQYRPGDELQVLYVGRSTDADEADWIYARHLASVSTGWVHKTSVSLARTACIPAGGHYSEGLSKALACILRHKALSLGLTVRAEGYIPVREVLKHVRCSMGKFDQTIRESRHSDGSARFETCMIDGEPHLRSTQRRSIPAPEVSAPMQTCMPSGPSTVPTPGLDSADAVVFLTGLKELCALRREGYLSAEEFHVAKTRILYSKPPSH